ncbi:hypothetical protein [Larsenimonas salina]|uniref:hypothetical protein n=1 Tax=Larsenimonas salina TaxID=1295565 RepID=UPI002073B7CE|nr:hypothetical protein [Larsenimonas salina]
MKKPLALMRPSTRGGWLCVGLFLMVIVSGLWPVVTWVNRPVLVAGLPLLAVWAYVIVAASTLAMVIGNRICGRGDDD